MCIRWQCYLVCTNCNNQFIDRDKGWDVAESARVLRKVGRSHGWRRARVENGSMWDFCPRCWRAYVEAAKVSCCPTIDGTLKKEATG